MNFVAQMLVYLILSFERVASATFASFLVNNFVAASPISADAPVIIPTLFLTFIDILA